MGSRRKLLEALSFPEFMQACASIVPGFSQGAAKSIFTNLDTNKNDKVSLEELTQTTEVARHFYQESKCGWSPLFLRRSCRSLPESSH